MTKQSAPQSPFLLDANVFLQARNHCYPFDICPGFWDALVRYRPGSVQQVRDELQDPEIKKWIMDNIPVDDFASTDEPEVVEAYRSIINWVHSQPQYQERAKAEFARVADGWIIAYALAHRLVVVTHEKPAPDSKKKVKIPDVCKAFKVKFVTTVEMLRSLQASFHLF